MDQEDTYHEARQKVTKIKNFYQYLGLYILVNALLAAINLIMSPGKLWFYWVTLFWGIAVIWQAYDVFGTDQILGKEWEEKKIKEYMEEKK